MAIAVITGTSTGIGVFSQELFVCGDSRGTAGEDFISFGKPLTVVGVDPEKILIRRQEASTFWQPQLADRFSQTHPMHPITPK